ncbi:MAG: hypothetical protein OHK0038_22870 [Flammeovirgaceae bacterium]
MLNFLKSLFGVKVPSGVIKLNDLHFISCQHEGRIMLLTWNNVFKKLTVSELKVDALKKMYGTSAYNLNEYGHLELINDVDNKILKFTMQIKSGKLTFKPTDSASQEVKFEYINQ